jgi:hypothetical protein
MTSVIRYTEIVNATGAALTPITGLVTTGKEGSDKYFKRIFAPADIGVGVGQTQDNANPTGGCLLVTIAGATIKEVGKFELYRPTVKTVTTFNDRVFATSTPHIFRYGYRISADGKSIYIFDSGDNAATQIAAADFISFSLIVGNY